LRNAAPTQRPRRLSLPVENPRERFIPAISDNLLDRRRGTIKCDYASGCALASHARARSSENSALARALIRLLALMIALWKSRSDSELHTRVLTTGKPYSPQISRNSLSLSLSLSRASERALETIDRRSIALSVRGDGMHARTHARARARARSLARFVRRVMTLSRRKSYRGSCLSPHPAAAAAAPPPPPRRQLVPARRPAWQEIIFSRRAFHEASRESLKLLGLHRRRP
jgi:hypothetical protein